MAKISGILTDGAGQIINNCTIELYAKKTTSKVLTQTQVFQVANNGSYMMNVLPCDYEVKLIINGFPPKRLGTIQVFSDSKDGTLNDFLLNPSESEITPEVLQQVVNARNAAKKSADDAKKFASTIDTSQLLKKSGDEMTGQLRMSAESAGIKFKYADSNNEFVLRTLSNSLSFIFYDEQIEKWSTKLAYITDKKQWCFLDVDDVTINNKSALKEGDAVQLLGDLANTNLNDLTGSKEGVYFQGRNAQASIENNYPIHEAGTLQVLKNGADGAGCCQIYTAYRNARQFIRNYRGGSKSWEPWIEQITSGNSTVDSNGFLKKASPILRLFANDNIEEADGFKKSGCALVNDLASGVTATRIDVGHYEIHGSLGFAKEGWYITLPEDVNGNKKFFAEYSVDENNIITVKTYTKKFDFENCQIVAGEPIDITEGRWIDIRLEMPVIENEEPIPSTLNPVIVSEVSDDI